MQEIILGNNIEVLKKYPNNYFDSIVTDPPYGLGKEPNANELMKDWIEKGYHEVGGSGFMGKEWDAFVPQPIFWKEVFRVLKHGGHVVAFYGTRTYDWGVMAMRFAGFEVRDCIQWLYGSGFPKSHNISKAIDKMYGAEREVVGEKSNNISVKNNSNSTNTQTYGIYGNDKSLTASATDQAKQWEGWGSALKPANEPIVLARKPLEKGLSIAENVLKWGTGGINIDGCRVGFTDNVNMDAKQKDFNTMGYGGANDTSEANMYNNQGRFPANLILTHHPECECVGTKKVKSQNGGNSRAIQKNIYNDFGKNYDNTPNGEKCGFADENGEETTEDWKCHEDCPIKILDEQSGESKSSQSMRGEGGGGNKVQQLNYRENSLRGHTDKEGASRFFYIAKASKSERNKGLEGFEEKEKPDNYIMPKLTCSECGSKRVDSSNTLVCGCNGKTHYEEQNSTESKNNLAGGNKNFHPTVKPIKLMQYLVRLITPPNGIVLDPFCGSGTTGIAAKIEGFNFVGIEMDEEYHKISKARIENYTIQEEDSKQLKLF